MTDHLRKIVNTHLCELNYSDVQVCNIIAELVHITNLSLVGIARDYTMTTRKLRRRKSDVELQSANNWITIWGIDRAPVAVGPPVLVDGIQGIVLYSSSRWLSQICFGHVPWAASERAVVKALITELKRGANYPCAGSQKNALAHSESEASGDEAAVGAVLDEKKKCAEWSSVECGGRKLQVFGKPGHGVVVEYTTDAVVAVCQRLINLRRESEKDDMEEFANALESMDYGRITFDRFMKAYVVVTSQGKKRKRKTNVSVVDQEPSQALKKARMLWNLVDTSDSLKYEIEAEPKAESTLPSKDCR